MKKSSRSFPGLRPSSWLQAYPKVPIRVQCKAELALCLPAHAGTKICCFMRMTITRAITCSWIYTEFAQSALTCNRWSTEQARYCIDHRTALVSAIEGPSKSRELIERVKQEGQRLTVNFHAPKWVPRTVTHRFCLTLIDLVRSTFISNNKSIVRLTSELSKPSS